MKLYDNARTVADENQILSDFQSRSLKCYQDHVHIKDIAYAPHARTKLDFFQAEQAEKTVIFIHGGYWQWCDKSDFAFIVPHVLAQHCHCVLLEYDLAPNSSLSEIVQQIQMGLDFIQQQIWCTKEVILVGHSAGAHLTALHLRHEMVTSAVLISGIYDLAPIAHTHLNQALNLTVQQIQDLSPILHRQAFHKPYAIIYGELELDELKEQSQHYFQKRQEIEPNWVTSFACPQHNHYSILEHYFKEIFKT